MFKIYRMDFNKLVNTICVDIDTLSKMKNKLLHIQILQEKYWIVFLKCIPS
jgi:hypothetical protein